MKIIIQLLLSSSLFMSACAQQKQQNQATESKKIKSTSMNTEKITFGNG